MSDEQKAELEATQAAKTAKDDEPAGDSTKVEPNEESKQLKAQLKIEREAREKAEAAAAELAYKRREEKRKEPKEEEDEDEEKPLTSKSLQVILAKEREAIRKEALASKAETIASSMTGDETERDLILEVFKNRSFPSHLSLEEQIEESYIIANKKRIMGENSELKRALRNKGNVSTDSSTTHHDAPTGSVPKLEQGEAMVMAQTGFKYNANARRYEKKLSNGQVLVQDPKTKQTRLIKA